MPPDRKNSQAVLIRQNKSADFVLVHAIEEDQQKIEKRSFYENNLKKIGLKLTYEINSTEKLCFIKISAPMCVLQKYCEVLKIKMPLQSITENGNKKKKENTGCIERCFGSKLMPKMEYKTTAEYSPNLKAFKNITEESFSKSVRCMIINFILERETFSNEVNNFGLTRLLSDKIYESGYPLHEGTTDDPYSEKGKLKTEWAQLKCIFKQQPMDYIKDYFGVKFALYFAWLDFYTKMLIFPSIFGLLCIGYGWYTYPNQLSTEMCDPKLNFTMCPPCDHNCKYWTIDEACYYSKAAHFIDNEFVVLFSICMSIWSALFLEFWKRHRAEIMHRWGMTGFDSLTETPRPEYFQKCAASNITNTRANAATNIEEPKVSFWRRKLPRLAWNYTVVLFMVCLALGVVFGIIMYSISVISSETLYGKQSEEYKTLFIPVTTGIFNLIAIIILNLFYDKIATRLTEHEYNRTQTDFDNSLMLKMYMFQFVNYYSSLFYIALVKGKFIGYPENYNRIFGCRQEECGPEGCLLELTIQLFIIMFGDQIKDNILEILWPHYIKIRQQKTDYNKTWLSTIFRYVRSKRKVQKEMNYDYGLLSWVSEEFFSEYLEMVLQYGFVTIFVSALPIAPLFALLNNIIEIRIDAMKYINHYRRPVPQRVANIGVWLRILDIIGKIAMVSNAFIIAFSFNIIPRMVYKYNVSPNGSYDGYLNYSLSYFDTRDFEHGMGPNSSMGVEMCRYEEHRNPPWHSDKYKKSPMFWQLLAWKLAFVVIYTYLVYFFITIIQLFIPDVPRKLQKKIKKEAYELREVIIKAAQSPSNVNSTTIYRRTEEIQYKYSGETSLQYKQ